MMREHLEPRSSALPAIVDASEAMRHPMTSPPLTVRRSMPLAIATPGSNGSTYTASWRWQSGT